MRSGARRGRGSRFPEGGGRRARWWPHHRTDVAVVHAQRREPGELVRAFPGGGGRRALVARRFYARGRRGRWPGGWLPCRFVRHFVTGRGVAVKRGLCRRSPGVVVKRGCAAVDGGARRFRGVMREDGGGAAVPGSYARGRRGAVARRVMRGDGGAAGGCRAGLPAIS